MYRGVLGALALTFVFQCLAGARARSTRVVGLVLSAEVDGVLSVIEVLVAKTLGDRFGADGPSDGAFVVVGSVRASPESDGRNKSTTKRN